MEKFFNVLKYILLIIPFFIIMIFNNSSAKTVSLYGKIENLSNLFGIVSAVLSIIVINSVNSLKKEFEEERNKSIINDQQKKELQDNSEDNINNLTDFITALSNIIISDSQIGFENDFIKLKNHQLYIYDLLRTNDKLFDEILSKTEYKDTKINHITNNLTKINFDNTNSLSRQKDKLKKLENDLRKILKILMLINKS